MKSESPWANRAESVIRRFKEQLGILNKDYQRTHGRAVCWKDVFGQTVVRHVEFLLNVVATRDFWEESGTSVNLSVYERHTGRPSRYNVVPLCTRVMY